MHNPLIELISLVEKVIDEADLRMIEIIKNGGSRDVYFSAPDVVLRLLEGAMVLPGEAGEGAIDIEKLKLLDNLNVVPSFDWAITLFHKDYPLKKHGWMIRKVGLNGVFEDKAGKIDKRLVFINASINLTIDNGALN
jgi:hypothetical protein